MNEHVIIRVVAAMSSDQVAVDSDQAAVSSDQAVVSSDQAAVTTTNQAARRVDQAAIIEHLYALWPGSDELWRLDRGRGHFLNLGWWWYIDQAAGDDYDAFLGDGHNDSLSRYSSLSE